MIKAGKVKWRAVVKFLRYCWVSTAILLLLIGLLFALYFTYLVYKGP